MVGRKRACLLLVACVTWTAPSRAQDDAPAAAEVPPAAESLPPAAESLPVTIKLVSTPIQAEAVRAAIEAELRVPVRIEDVATHDSLSVTVKWRRATVSYRSKNGEATTRSLDLPANTDQAVEVIALLAGNLARDEASELLQRLTPPPTAPEPDAAEETPPPVAEAPAAPAAPPVEPKPEPEAPKPTEKKPDPTKRELDGLIRGNPTSLNLTLWHPKTLLDHTERRVINGELGLAYSRIGAIEGAGFTGGYLRVDHDVRGAVGSFGWTRVDGDVIGLQWGGLFTEGHGKIRGAEIAELASFRWGNVEGAQSGGLFSRAANVTGAQLSAGVALADDVLGVQTGLVSVARDVKGAQVNLVGVTRDIEGGQLGLVNVSRDIEGGQLGLVNVARSVDVQLGLVNVAERVDYAALGLVSIAGNGSVEPTMYALLGKRGTLNAGVKFVAGFTYSLLAGGLEFSGGESDPLVEAGGGFHYEPFAFRNAPVVDRVALELGAHVGHVFRPSGEDDRLHYRAGAGMHLFDWVWLYVGYDVSHDISPFGDAFADGTWLGLSLQ